jgi:hypothetical protein
MQHDVGQTANAPQTGGTIKIGKQGAGAAGAPERKLRRVTQQGEDPIMAEQTGQGSASHITAADDQKFLHGAILPDSSRKPH